MTGAPAQSPDRSPVRDVFFVSDGTGITSETLGNAILTQFEHTRLRHHRISFVDSIDKAREAVLRIDEAFRSAGQRPIVFTTLVNGEVNAAVRQAPGLILDLFETFVVPLENELGSKSTHTVGRSHNVADSHTYRNRIEAINFALMHDDGQSAQELERADVILIGVSRCGKTPTSLYLAMQFGVKAANYPLIPEDFERDELPGMLDGHRERLFGLTIAPERLAEVRRERRPGSVYASLDNCRREVIAAERLMRRAGVRTMNSTTKSIEEIAVTVLQSVRRNGG
jgi:regulator of PEP synthase PpsR (kinase-PPPase family)